MLEIGAIVWGVKDIPRAVAFWKAALDYELKCPISDDWAVLVPKDGNGIQLSLNKITSPKAKRHHMDIFSDHQEEDVARLIALGAVRKEWNYEPDADYVVLQDPDGNPFCVVQR